MLIRNAAVYLDGTFHNDIEVRIHNVCVQELGQQLENGLYEDSVDLCGDYLLPGFVDVHIHAFKGHDTMNGENDVRAMSRDLYRAGVAAFLPTTMSASADDTRKVVEGVRQVMSKSDAHASKVLGVHMEAPFLAESKAGAQLKQYFTAPSMEMFTYMAGSSGIVRILTMAPERLGAEAFIQEAVASGVHVSIGHSAASAEQVHRAASWGVDHVTHTFNAQTPLHHREPGIPGAALTDDRLYCEAICDGIHLHPDIIRLMYRSKGAQKMVAITDAMEAAGMPDGVYSLGGQSVYVSNHEARLSDGTLAGSVLTMQQAFKNLIAWGIPVEDAVTMCTATPADSIGEKSAGRIQPGSPAPLTRWNRQWQMIGIVD